MVYNSTEILGRVKLIIFRLQTRRTDGTHFRVEELPLRPQTTCCWRREESYGAVAIGENLEKTSSPKPEGKNINTTLMFCEAFAWRLLFLTRKKCECFREWSMGLDEKSKILAPVTHSRDSWQLTVTKSFVQKDRGVTNIWNRVVIELYEMAISISV